MRTTVDELTQALVDSGLASAQDIREFRASFSAEHHPNDGRAFSEFLIAQNRLTPFQASELLEGTGVPLVLGDYILLSKIGAGGMGQVFLAHHARLDRRAAIKILPTALTKNPDVVRRFEREAKAAAKLSHPNIVHAYDASVQGDVWYLVMEYVPGTDLATLVVRDGPLPIARAVDYVRQAARGLAYAHKQGIVHRDVKPANLLINTEGVLKILDLGLARFQDAAMLDGLTQSGQVMGTVDYMSPEQAFNMHTADARSDIYSLGCTLHRLLTGQAMYAGDAIVQKLLAHQQQPIPKLADACRQIPPSLEQAFAKMVAKKPADRFQSMAEVEDALARTLGEPAKIRSHDAFLPADTFEPTLSLAAPNEITHSTSSQAVKVSSRSRARGAWQPIIVWVAVGLAVATSAVLMWRFKAFVERPDVQSNAVSPPADSTTPTPAVAPFDAIAARSHQAAWAAHLGVPIETRNSIGMTMVLIPPGEFLMGSTPSELASLARDAGQLGLDPQATDFTNLESEMPQHRVVFTKPLWMACTEVTIHQFSLFVDAEHHITLHEQLEESGPEQGATSNWRDPKMYPVTEHSPVTLVAYSDAVLFCNWLSRLENLEPCYEQRGSDWELRLTDGYRLPTEAEWEYACRAGSNARFFSGDAIASIDLYAWTNRNSEDRAHPVGQRRPNAFGLFDMPGNVWELCQDTFDPNWYSTSSVKHPLALAASPSQLCTRGGSWIAPVNDSRSAARGKIGPTFRWAANGFRVVRMRID